MASDFRVTCSEAGFAVNFTKLGFDPGFGLTVTHPAAIGRNNAALTFNISRRVTGEDAVKMGLASIWCRSQTQGRPQRTWPARSLNARRSCSSRRGPTMRTGLLERWPRQPTMS